MVLWNTNGATRTRADLGFGLGNLLVAGLLALGISTLPVRFWPIDALLALLALLLLGSGIALLAKARIASRAVRIAASALLLGGLSLVAVALLTLAFLSGVHGRWLDAGLPLTALTLALLVPYTVAYPLAQLLYFSPRAQETPRGP